MAQLLLSEKTLKEHCRFAKLNSAGRCTAYCDHNIRRNYQTDCTGKTGGSSISQGNEVRLRGRRHE